MYPIQTCMYDVCMCMYFFAHTYKISQLLCCLYVLKNTYKYKHAGSLMCLDERKSFNARIRNQEGQASISQYE